MPPRGIRAIVPDGDPGHFKGMKVFCHPRRMAAFGGRRRDPRHSVAVKGEYDTGVAHSLARSGADVGRRRLYVLRVSPCTRQEESPARGGALTGDLTTLLGDQRHVKYAPVFAVPAWGLWGSQLRIIGMPLTGGAFLIPDRDTSRSATPRSTTRLYY